MIKDDASTRARRRHLQSELRKLDQPQRKARQATAKRSRHERAKGLTGQQGQREPRQRDNDYLKWIRRLPCVACATRRNLNLRGVEAAHIRCGYAGEEGWRPTGMGERPHDWRCAPLCVSHHREGPKAQHSARERSWWEDLGIYPPDLCADLHQAFNRGESGTPVILRYARWTK